MNPPPFPFQPYSEQDIQENWEKVQHYAILPHSSGINKLLHHKGYNGSNAFFQEERMKIPGENGSSPLSTWNRRYEHFQQYIRSQKDTPFHCITLLTKPCAPFSVSIVIQMIRRYHVTHLFDPFMGWGDRCYGAMACGIHYTGCDTNLDLEPCFQRMVTTLNPSIPPTLFFQSCHITPIPQEVDMIFSSPPFFKKGKLQEKYPYCETDEKQFMESILLPLRHRYPGRIALHLPPIMAQQLQIHWGTWDEELPFGMRDCIYVWNPLPPP